MEKYFKDKNVLVTGGLGFIGSNLAIKLVSLGANVTIADAMIDGYGGNRSLLGWCFQHERPGLAGKLGGLTDGPPPYMGIHDDHGSVQLPFVFKRLG